MDYNNLNKDFTIEWAWIVSIWALYFSAIPSKAVLCSPFKGSAGGESILSGFTGLPFFHTRKSRCGPVERPVEPTYPMTSPWRTRWPTLRPFAYFERWRYAVLYTELCVIRTVFPPAPSYFTLVTTPSPILITGVPVGAA